MWAIMVEERLKILVGGGEVLQACDEIADEQVVLLLEFDELPAYDVALRVQLHAHQAHLLEQKQIDRNRHNDQPRQRELKKHLQPVITPSQKLQHLTVRRRGRGRVCGGCGCGGVDRVHIIPPLAWPEAGSLATAN